MVKPQHRTRSSLTEKANINKGIIVAHHLNLHTEDLVQVANTAVAIRQEIRVLTDPHIRSLITYLRLQHDWEAMNIKCFHLSVTSLRHLNVYSFNSGEDTSERAATASTAGPSTAEVSSTLPTTETETERTARVEPITKPSDAITQEGATTVEQLAAELAKLVSLVDSVNLPPVYTYSLFIYHEPYGLGRRSATRATPGFNRALAVGVMDSERMGAVLSKIKPLEMLGLRDVYRSLFDRDLMDDVRDNKVGLVVRQDPEEEIRTINHDFMGARYELPSDRAVTILKAVGVPTQEQLDTLSPSVAATGSVTSSGMTGNDELSGRAFH
ncbi:hypothetical protein BO82DRAFT_401530 [Aspergillus uvarum CBS 121591]|uniref:Uncharacterized protein n=1 Tax=Aspergillus uvarum CBS 121591 TaxID=1448315 RepID=A0A319CDL9_9EURO|nr:hypothetical protein BO82DRAFT_401530 [Aspergillus uvarum CBS 121591]PYH82550.1 hypothetical protein BO82DRAFT_401530 [Aspergillus uvarum CBS 121591]